MIGSSTSGGGGSPTGWIRLSRYCAVAGSSGAAAGTVPAAHPLYERPGRRSTAPREDPPPASRTPAVPSPRSAVEHRPADVVPQALVVEDELADRLREPVALPLALASPRCLPLAWRRGSTCGLDRVRGRPELVRGDVRHDPGLA